MNQDSSSQTHEQAPKTESNIRALTKTCAGEWLAPMVAWAAVSALCLAIAGLLLGEE